MFDVAITNPFNMSNFTTHFLQYAFNPYLSLLGNFTWGAIFGFIGAAIYVSSEYQLATILGYLAVVGLIFSIILPFGLLAVLGMLFMFMAASIIYKTLVR